MGIVTPQETAQLFGVPAVTNVGPTVLPNWSRTDLCRLFAQSGFTQGAEIGVWTGQFSKRICQLVPGVHLRCVDPWEPYHAYRERKNDPVRMNIAHQEALERLRPFHCTFMRMKSLEAARLVPDQTLDFVYLDGNHECEYVQADLEAWLPKVRPGGIMSGHDFHTSADEPFVQVEVVVREFTRVRGISPWFVLTGEKAPSFCWVVA